MGERVEGIGEEGGGYRWVAEGVYRWPEGTRGAEGRGGDLPILFLLFV